MNVFVDVPLSTRHPTLSTVSRFEYFISQGKLQIITKTVTAPGKYPLLITFQCSPILRVLLQLAEFRARRRNQTILPIKYF